MTEIRLERLAARHLAGLEALVQDDEVRRFTRVPDPPPAGFAQAWLDRYLAGEADGSCAGFAVLDGDRFVGVGVAPRIEPPARELELGYVIAPGERGKGFATAALRAMTDWAFGEARALRVYLYIDAGNAPSLRVAERAGYVREGVLRSAWVKQEQRADTVLLSLLPGDPRT